MSTPNLEELAALEAAATPAPWEAADGTPAFDYMYDVTHQRDGSRCTLLSFNPNFRERTPADRNLVASARNSLRWLIERAKQAERYEAALREIADYFASGGSCTEFVRDTASTALEGNEGESDAE